MHLAIIGFGWLGNALGSYFQAKDYKISCSSTSFEKVESLVFSGVDAFLLDEHCNSRLPESVINCDFAVICIPPSRSRNYSLQVASIAGQFSAETKLIFTSSIGVYPDNAAYFDETSPVISDHVVAQAENAFMETGKKRIILRLGGLIGPGRNPAYYLSGKTVKNPDKAVNLIHQMDVVRAIELLFNSNFESAIHNLVYPEHPSRKDFYSRECEVLKLPLPQFVANENEFDRVIDGNKISKKMNFIYENSIFTAS